MFDSYSQRLLIYELVQTSKQFSVKNRRPKEVESFTGGHNS